MIKSTSYSQTEIIKWIIELYSPNGIQLDPTFSKGVFYKKIAEPLLKFDISPQREDVQQADCTELPLKSGTIDSIMFDPPFLSGGGGNGEMIKRFSNYKNVPTLWGMYRAAMAEFYRLLNKNGVLIFKCQDTIESTKQYFTEFWILKEALSLGLYPIDKFILAAKSRLVSPSQRKQQHARKYHCYFLVFIKKAPRVNYDLVINYKDSGEYLLS